MRAFFFGCFSAESLSGVFVDSLGDESVLPALGEDSTLDTVSLNGDPSLIDCVSLEAGDSKLTGEDLALDIEGETDPLVEKEISSLLHANCSWLPSVKVKK